LLSGNGVDMEDIIDAEKAQPVAAKSKTGQQSLKIWNLLHRLQTDFSLPQELTVYHTCTAWLTARNVLDIGTGNGYYLSQLAARFPDKRFIGIDLSEELIELANSEASADNIEFFVDHLETISGNYDFVMLRLVLQHIPEAAAMLPRLAEFIVPDGHCLIIDACDEFRYFEPALPEFMDFFQKFIAATQHKGLDRNIVEKIKPSIAASPYWEMEKEWILTIPSTWPQNMEKFKATYVNVLDLTRQERIVDCDYSAIKEAWNNWANNPNAYAQVGLKVLLLKRTQRPHLSRAC